MVSGFVNREIVMVCDKQKVTTDLKNGTWTFDEAFLQFNRYCIIKNLREKTIKDYQEAYERFVSFLRQYTLLSVVGELARIHIEDYILHLKGTGMKDTSINTYLRGIRVILNFLSEQEASVRIKVPMQKTDKMIKETYTDNELFKLLEKPNISKCEFLEYRNWCIINFLLATGVRISTLINIKISDLDFDFARIHLVYTKSRKSYIIPMSNAIKEVLLEYLSFRKGNADDYLFCNQYGEFATADSIKHSISKYNKTRGVQKTSLHAFRHTFAKKCVLNNVNVFVLQRLLGHTDIKVTKEYIDLYSDELAVNIDKYNPLDTLGTPCVSGKTDRGHTNAKRIKMV